ncbi:MAG: hypothetical protein V4625_01645 [Pseudomonadota bacterium]
MAASHTLPMPAAMVPAKIATKVIADYARLYWVNAQFIEEEAARKSLRGHPDRKEEVHKRKAAGPFHLILSSVSRGKVHKKSRL